MSSTMYRLWTSTVHAGGMHFDAFWCVFAAPNPSPLMTMTSPVPAVVNVLAVPDDARSEHINPATSSRTGSISCDWEENGYNLEWESRANFNNWLTHEQAALRIEIRVSKTWVSKSRQLYSTCKTFHCTCNGTGGKTKLHKENSTWTEDQQQMDRWQMSLLRPN